MPVGPQGQKRPADAIGCAIAVARIATGEASEDAPDVRRERGAAGGLGRAANLTANERSEIAHKAAEARWSDRNENRKGAL